MNIRIATAAWSAAYGTLGLLWGLGLGGFPFGVGDPEAADMGSLLVGVRPETAGPLIGQIGFLAAALALASGPWQTARARRIQAVFAWLIFAGIALAVPDVRLMRDFGYAFMLSFSKLDWPTLNQLLCVGGAVLWGLTATRLLQDPAKTGTKRRRHDWARAGAIATTLAILLPIPYEIVRWAWAAGIPLGVAHGANLIEGASGEARAGMFVLGLLPLIGGLLTHGLISRWGERYPSWIPWKADRRIHPAVVVAPAAAASLMIIAAGLTLIRIELNEWLGRVQQSDPDVTGWGAWAPGIFWLPWGLALAVATYAYWRRRRADGTRSAGVAAMYQEAR